jgi:hypothetical protein
MVAVAVEGVGYIPYIGPAVMDITALDFIQPMA